MTLGIGQLGPAYPSPDPTQRSRFTPSAPAATPVLGGGGGDRVELSHGTPPPEVLAQVERAAARAAELASQNRELHFSKDEESGRVIVQVRDLEGNVIRTIPNKHALEVIMGAQI